MNGFRYELKKIMLYQKGLLCILAFLLLSTAALAGIDSPQISAMEEYRSKYEWYLNQVSGKNTAETSGFLEAEANLIADAKNRRGQIMEQYYSGELSMAAYQRQRAEIDQILAHQNGFDVIYQQYLYISEAPDHRYFVQTNGWAGLLTGGTLDFLLLIAILILAAPAFCAEFICQMDTLILTTKGCRKSARHKLLIVLGTVFVLCLVESLLRLGFFSLKYGLPNGAYPIQSVSYFGSSSKQISLWGGYAAITISRCCGGLFLATLLLFFSVVVKKYALTMLLGAGSTLIPYIGLPESILYRLPLPLPLLLGTGFLRGTISAGDSLKNEAVPLFQEVSDRALAHLLLASAAICLFAIFWILRCHSNHWQANRAKTPLLSAAAMGIALMVTLSGCTGRPGMDAADDASPSNCAEYEVIQDFSTQRYYLRHSSTGTVVELPRSPMFGAFSDSESIISDYCCAPYLYYTTSQTEQVVDRVGSYNSGFTKVSVVELNLETFEERVIFEKITDTGRSLLGIDYETGDKWVFLQYHTGLFLNNTNLFFIGIDGVTQVNRMTGQVQNLEIPTNGTLAFDGRSIFFINDQSVLAKLDTQEGTTTVYDPIIAYDFFLDGDTIYYINRMDSNHVYLSSLDGAHTSMVSDIPAIAVSCQEDTIYLTAKRDGKQIAIPKPRTLCPGAKLD